VAVVERELAGGECSYWACIPSKTLLRPGEAAYQARHAAAAVKIDMGAALAYRDFMVANYSDAGQQAWLAGKGIDLIRGTGTLAGPGVVEVGGRRYTAAHVVLATGSDPVLPPVPGPRELDGVWTNREATGMKTVPRWRARPGGVVVTGAAAALGGFWSGLEARIVKSCPDRSRSAGQGTASVFQGRDGPARGLTLRSLPTPPMNGGTRP